MENLTCELNGIKYLLVDVLATYKNKESVKGKCRKYEAIYQGIKEIKEDGFFTDGYIIAKVLVPEKNIIEWNK